MFSQQDSLTRLDRTPTPIPRRPNRIDPPPIVKVVRVEPGPLHGRHAHRTIPGVLRHGHVPRAGVFIPGFYAQVAPREMERAAHGDVALVGPGAEARRAEEGVEDDVHGLQHAVRGVAAAVAGPGARWGGEAWDGRGLARGEEVGVVLVGDCEGEAFFEEGFGGFVGGRGGENGGCGGEGCMEEQENEGWEVLRCVSILSEVFGELVDVPS